MSSATESPTLSRDPEWLRRDAASRPLTASYWNDPDPKWQGMLSSDLIAYYHEQVGGMIGPWADAQLKPASYELTLGPNCLVNGERVTLTEAKPWLELPHNSIVFVSMGEWIRLPHYIAARFDLAIEFVYQGILLGTGPQVDPGFQGVLSCPLHNISNESVHIKLGHPFAKMDFAKTSGLCCARDDDSLVPIDTEDGLYAAAIAGSLPGKGDHRVVLFNHDKRWRDPIFAQGYAGQKQVSSSVAGLESDVEQAREEVEAHGDDMRRFRRFAIAGSIAIIVAIGSLLLALAQLDRSYTDSKVDNIARSPEVSGPVVNLNRRLDRLTVDNAELNRRVNQLKRQLAELREQRRETSSTP